MFIAMNRFQVIKGNEKAFEQIWLSRDTYLGSVPGFVKFHLLRGPEAEDHTLYASHTIWKSRDSLLCMDQIRGVPSRSRERWQQ
jgi:heme-degrading monooxygenase HmoA